MTSKAASTTTTMAVTQETMTCSTNSNNDYKDDDYEDPKGWLFFILMYVFGGIGTYLCYLLVLSDDIIRSPWLDNASIFVIFMLASSILPVLVSVLVWIWAMAVHLKKDKKKDDDDKKQNNNDDHSDIIERIEKTRFHVSLRFVGVYTVCQGLLGYLFFYSFSEGNPFVMVLLLSLVSVSSIAVAYFSTWMFFGSTASLLQQQLEQLGLQDDDYKKMKREEFNSDAYCFTLFVFISIIVTLMVPLGATAFYVADAAAGAIVFLLVLGTCLATSVVGRWFIFGLPLLGSSQQQQQQSSQQKSDSSSTIHPKSSLSLTEASEVIEDNLFEF